MSAALSRSKMGGILSTRELLDIASLLHAANQVRKYGNEQQDNGVHTSLDTMFARINSNRYLEEKINRAIISEEEIADAASSELANIRRQIRQQNVHVRETLNHYVSSATYSKYLQETIITQRDGRYVIPVKSEHKGDVPGMVHDISSSGATLFIEPTQVVNANNQIKILQGKEKAEIERILAELTADVEGFSEAIAADYDVLCKLDFIFAKANYSFQLNACSPKLSEKTQVQLIQARHPLLDQKKAVAIDIALGCDYDTLVITGPNTGGKTVSLKTLGLLSLMAASGLHIPANEESEVCLFQNIYADIGDEQSIEQSLSTFSAHMKNTVSIMEKCGPDDLILFDELGAGTDPEEGAALAVAIIEYGRKMGSLVAATTHYSELKVFALTTEGVENASCEFDVRTLQPTYRLLTGVPGKSNAFAISKRLGLQPAIIEQAKKQISEENVRFEDVLGRLEKERHQLQKQREDADRLRRTAQSEKDKAVTMKGRAEDETDAILEKAREQAARILRDARIASDTVLAQLDEMKKQANTNASDQNLAAARAALRSTLGQAEKKAGHREKKTVEAGQHPPAQGGRYRLSAQCRRAGHGSQAGRQGRHGVCTGGYFEGQCAHQRAAHRTAEKEAAAQDAQGVPDSRCIAGGSPFGGKKRAGCPRHDGRGGAHGGRQIYLRLPDGAAGCCDNYSRQGHRCAARGHSGSPAARQACEVHPQRQIRRRRHGRNDSGTEVKPDKIQKLWHKKRQYVGIYPVAICGI